MKCRTCGNDLQGNEYNCPFCGSCVDYTQAVEQAKAGREEGFTFLYENTYRNKLYIAMKYMKNEQDAMDILQDAYIKAFARFAGCKCISGMDEYHRGKYCDQCTSEEKGSLVF